MTPTVMKFIDTMLEKKRSEILNATHPEIREIIEALLKFNDNLEPQFVQDGPAKESALRPYPPLSKNPFNI